LCYRLRQPCASSVRKGKIWTPRTLAWIKQIRLGFQIQLTVSVNNIKYVDEYVEFVESMDKLRFSLENLMNRPHKQSPVLLENTIDRLAQTSATMSFYYAQWAPASAARLNCLFTAINQKDGNKMKRILKFDVNSDEP